jgi:chlorophyll synthase
MIGDAAGQWLTVAWPLLAGVLCLGPLIWGSTLLYNNYRDLGADRANPRRARDPLVLGIITPRQALVGSWVLGLAGLALAALIGPAFLAFMAACLALSWAYSAPPLLLKGRAGLDVLVNVVGIGLLCTLAGWSLAAPLRDFPWPFMALPVLLMASAYIPTTLVDYRTDKAFGVSTIAVRLGPERAFWVGFGIAVLSNLVWLGASLANYIVTWSVYQWLWPLGVVELWAYLGLRNWEDFAHYFRRLALAVGSFGLGIFVFALHYTGWLRL